MGLCIVRDVVSHPGTQNDHSAIFQFRMQFASITQQEVTFVAPVIGAVAGGILHHADADVAELSGAPCRFPGFARMVHAGDGLPVDRLKRDVLQLHLGHRWRKATENLQETRVLDVAAAQYHGGILVGHPVTLLQ
jgi:hypothetical protein